MDFVRKAVACIGHVALRLEAAAQKCVEALLDLIKLKVSYVVQEAVVVIKVGTPLINMLDGNPSALQRDAFEIALTRSTHLEPRLVVTALSSAVLFAGPVLEQLPPFLQDIFRCYPHRFEAAITDVCAALDVLEEPEAKAALVWIVGEYAERIDNADELLTFLLDNFLDEPVAVQLQLLTATVKLFLKKAAAEGAQAMISSVLTAATQQTDNPDLRDRAFMYWRMLSAMPEVRLSQ